MDERKKKKILLFGCNVRIEPKDITLKIGIVYTEFCASLSLIYTLWHDKVDDLCFASTKCGGLLRKKNIRKFLKQQFVYGLKLVWTYQSNLWDDSEWWYRQVSKHLETSRMYCTLAAAYGAFKPSTHFDSIKVLSLLYCSKSEWTIPIVYSLLALSSYQKCRNENPFDTNEIVMLLVGFRWWCQMLNKFKVNRMLWIPVKIHSLPLAL